MNLTDDQIVKILLAKYKQEGKDLAYVVQDPVFNSLSLASKIEALKKFAEEMKVGTSSGLKGSDLKPVGIAAGFGALSGVLSVPAILRASSAVSGDRLARRMLNSRASIFSKVLGGLAGAAVGGFAAYMDARDEVENRDKMRNTLSNLSKDPTDTKAVYSLSSLQSTPRPSLFRNKLSLLLQERLNENNRVSIPNTYLNELKEIKKYKS